MHSLKCLPALAAAALSFLAATSGQALGESSFIFTRNPTQVANGPSSDPDFAGVQGGPFSPQGYTYTFTHDCLSRFGHDCNTAPPWVITRWFVERHNDDCGPPRDWVTVHGLPKSGGPDDPLPSDASSIAVPPNQQRGISVNLNAAAVHLCASEINFPFTTKWNHGIAITICGRFAPGGPEFCSGAGAATGFYLLAAVSDPGIPRNNDFADAVPIKEKGVYTGNNIHATLQVPEQLPFPGDRTVWYAYTAQTSGRVSLSTFWSTFDTFIAVYTGPFSSLNLVGANDNISPQVLQSALSFDAVAGTTYFIQIGSTGGTEGGSWQLNVGPPQLTVSSENGTPWVVDGSQNQAPNPSTKQYTLYNGSVQPVTVNAITDLGAGVTLPAAINLNPGQTATVDVALTEAIATTVGTKIGKIFFVATVSGSEVVRAEAPVTVVTRRAVETTIVSATLPVGRAGVVGDVLTIFTTILNSGAAQAIGCRPAANPGLPVVSTFQTTDPATNLLIGIANQAINIAPGVAQTFLLAVQSLAVLSQELALDFVCANTENAPSTPGVNTMLLTALAVRPADMISVGETVTHDGIIRVPVGGGAPFATATVNIGTSATITAVPTTTPAGKAPRDLGLTLFVCETTGSPGGACLATPSATLDFTATPNQAKTFTVFVNSDGRTIPFDPGNSRVFLYFRQGTIDVGGTSAAVRTP